LIKSLLFIMASKKNAQNASEEAQKTREETFKVKGKELLSKVEELIKEGNVRKITIKNAEGKTIVQFPLTFGVIGAVIAPMLAAVGAIAALVTECSITVERDA
jgi:hypothetical protein